MTGQGDVLLELAERYRDLCIQLVGDVEELTRENAVLRVERDAADALLGTAMDELVIARQEG